MAQVGVVGSPGGGHRLVGDGCVVGAGNRFLDHLSVRGFSPATVRACAFDLANFAAFLADRWLGLGEVAPTDLFDYLDWQRSGRAASGEKVVVLRRRGPV
ncbi:MAG: site-specific integrase, partial [Candidatus Limnocylindria bacterium]